MSPVAPLWEEELGRGEKGGGTKRGSTQSKVMGATADEKGRRDKLVKNQF